MKTKKPKPPQLTYMIGVGGTAIGAGEILGTGIYTLEQMNECGKINAGVDPENISATYPKTTVMFLNVRAVDREIRRLNWIKNKMVKFEARFKALKKGKK
jgi:hypothetical protein